MTLAKKPRIILWDIETSHNLAAVFQLAHNDWIPPDNIIQERYIVSAAWKVLGQRGIHTISVLDAPGIYKTHPHCDIWVCRELRSMLADADLLIHHNGNKFDLRYVETRLLINGLKPLPPIPTLDTYQLARSRLLFNSNRLDYLGHALGVGRKKPTTPGLWLRVLGGDQRAVREMIRYNKQDVALLERVFLKLRQAVTTNSIRQVGGGLKLARRRELLRFMGCYDD